jgi:hypothetical protein
MRIQNIPRGLDVKEIREFLYKRFTRFGKIIRITVEPNYAQIQMEHAEVRIRL